MSGKYHVVFEKADGTHEKIDNLIDWPKPIGDKTVADLLPVYEFFGDYYRCAIVDATYRTLTYRPVTVAKVEAR